MTEESDFQKGHGCLHLLKQLKKVIELLSEVAEKQGAYSRDQLQHAENVIENASNRAKESIKILEDVVAVGVSKVELEKHLKTLKKEHNDKFLAYCDGGYTDAYYNGYLDAYEFAKEELEGLLKK